MIIDRRGNIWASSQNEKSKGGTLSRYDEKSLSTTRPTVIEVEGVIFGMFEASDGSIWFGTQDGVHRYDGNTVFDFK